MEVLKETGKPVMANLCITSTTDDNGVPADECAVRLAKAGKAAETSAFRLVS